MPALNDLHAPTDGGLVWEETRLVGLGDHWRADDVGGRGLGAVVLRAIELKNGPGNHTLLELSNPLLELRVPLLEQIDQQELASQLVCPP